MMHIRLLGPCNAAKLCGESALGYMHPLPSAPLAITHDRYHYREDRPENRTKRCEGICMDGLAMKTPRAS